jgi:hypothetical protein
MKYLIIILAFVFMGCEATDENGNKAHFGIQILTIDGCEYVVYVNSQSGSCAMTHHANCHNPIHKLENK